MYYPYLRGRQFELIALREFATQRGDQNNIIPIIEPVRATFNSIKLALPKLIENDVAFALILNPQVGEIKDSNKIINELNAVIQDRKKWIPAFHVTNNYNLINSLIAEHALENVMLICSEMADVNDTDFKDLLYLPYINYIVSKENRTLKRFLRGQNKKIIKLDDNFQAQQRNSDYLKMQEEKFTEEHLYYEEDGYNGFADFTVVSSDFKEGGATPFAVAIHLTYEKESEEVWIKHFTSESNQDRANIQGKFAEATAKAITFLDDNGIQTFASNELREYFNSQKYPGLGMVKKISIKHHLELMNRLLTH